MAMPLLKRRAVLILMLGGGIGSVSVIARAVLTRPKKSLELPPLPQGLTLQSFKFEVVQVNPQGKIIKRTPAQAQSFQERLPGKIPLEMVAIPGGEFLMGSPASEAGHWDDESPQHQVSIRPFYMGKYEVTQQQWRAVASLPKVDKNFEPESAAFQGKNRPVENVILIDALEFCKRLSQATGRHYRLPSESEWEYACRAGTTTPYYFGSTLTSELANYDPKSTGVGMSGEVGQYPPNVFGLYDMHGNIAEWCRDTWRFSYEDPPSGGSAWVWSGSFENEPTGMDGRPLLAPVPEGAMSHVMRGGSFYNNSATNRSAARTRGYPGEGVGFRVVCEVAKI
jgi:formylglycine-generating enzyme required for sulfatase activity